MIRGRAEVIVSMEEFATKTTLACVAACILCPFLVCILYTFISSVITLHVTLFYLSGLCSFLLPFVHKDIHHEYMRMLLFPPLLFIATLSHTSSNMRLVFLYTDFSAFHPITVDCFYHAVQPYFMYYLYTGISHDS